MLLALRIGQVQKNQGIDLAVIGTQQGSRMKIPPLACGQSAPFDN
jgi:hypothetical protein